MTGRTWKKATMSTLGKVLTFLNVIFAIILLFLAAKDYGEFRAARYAAFRHELILTGLPVDANERNPEHPDDPIADKLSTEVLKDVFARAAGGADLGGGPVGTVLEEVDRVQAKVKSNIESSAPEIQKQKLRSYLLMQAKDTAERDQFRAMIDKGDTAACLAELDKRFGQVKSLHGPKETPNWDGVRFAAAHLFVNLSTDPEWLERVRTVVGLDPMIHGLDSAAHAMNQMAAGVKQAMIADQGAFIEAYQDSVRRLQYESENLFQATRRLAELKKVTSERDKEVAQRTTEVNKNKTELDALTAATNTEIAKLQAIQTDLFALQQRLGQTLESTYKLDEQLRQRAGLRK